MGRARNTIGNTRQDMSAFYKTTRGKECIAKRAKTRQMGGKQPKVHNHQTAYEDQGEHYYEEDKGESDSEDSEEEELDPDFEVHYHYDRYLEDSDKEEEKEEEDEEKSEEEEQAENDDLLRHLIPENFYDEEEDDFQYEAARLLEIQKIEVTGRDFDILSYVYPQVEEIKAYTAPLDDNTSLNVPHGLTKGEFARRLQGIYDAHSLHEQVQSEINSVVVDAFESTSNLPFCRSIRSRKDGSKKVVSLLGYHNAPKPRILSFDICPLGHTVFVGNNNDLTACPVCNSTREGNHKINYRCLIPLLVRLLQKDLFHLAINYHNEDSNGKCIADLKDGCAVKKAFEDMEENFLSKYWNGAVEGETTTPINVPLILSMGWDGLQAYSTKVAPFWPTFVCIENLPPTFRKVIGAGTFLLSIFTQSSDSGVEDFIFSHCLIPELNKLYDGIEVRIKNKTFFLQAR